MYVLKITLVLLASKLSRCQGDSASPNYDVTSYQSTTSTPDTNGEYRSASTSTSQDVVSIGYSRHKTDRHKPSDHSYHSSTESHDLKTSSATPYPVGYDLHSSSTQADLKVASSTSNYETYSSPSSALPSQYLETTLSPPVLEHYTTAKFQNHNQDLYQPSRSPLLNHQSTPITIDYSSTPITPTASTPLEQYKGTPAPLPPQYGPLEQYHPQPVNFSPLPQSYSPQHYSQPAPIPSSPYYPTPPPHYNYYQSSPPPVPYDHYHSQGPPVPPQYPPASPPSHPAYPLQTSFSPASGTIHSTTTVTPHADLGSTTPSIYDYSTVAPLQPQYDFIRENYENTETSQPPPQPYDHSLTLAPPLPPQYDPSAYLTVPNSQHYLDNIYRPYSTSLRKHNPSPSFEFNPTPHNPTHYIHNIPHYLTPSYDAYTKAPYPNGGGHPHYYKPLYNPYNPSVPQYSPGPGHQPYPPQYSSNYSPQIPQYESYNYPPIYRPPVPPNYQPHHPVKTHSTLYHLQASKELNPSLPPATEKTHELKEAREYKQHGYHNYQVTEKPASYNVQEG
ncbi:hypothetical protein M8J76_000763 [Diaphorina citri]|nr:hypothetical protein M8J75_010637 [Diaphorina citri]KAI5740132.1 hypothetical protein M8J76_000763 [Diaphorina citri]